MKRTLLLSLITCSLILVSCSTSVYILLTTIHPDGSFSREMTIRFKPNPPTDTPLAEEYRHLFPFNADSTWQVTITPDSRENRDGEEGFFLIRAHRHFASVEAVEKAFHYTGEWEKKKITPREQLQKRNTFFYTYYHYTATYPRNAKDYPVPMDTYLTSRDQQLLFGSDSAWFRGMIGHEIYETLDNASGKLETWALHNLYLTYFRAIRHYTELAGGKRFLPALDSIASSYKNMQQFDSEGGDFLLLFDTLEKQLNSHLHTSFFTSLMEQYSTELDDYLEQELDFFDSGQTIRYDLVMPGKILSANTELIRQDTVSWNINTLRFLTDDYVLTATSRKLSGWRLALTAILVVGALGWAFRPAPRPHGKQKKQQHHQRTA